MASDRAMHYDLLGSTAIIDPKGAADWGAELARKIMKENPTIRTVLAKAGPVSGPYRTRKFKYVAGDKKYAVEYRESGCTFTFDPRKAFFSSRLSFERSRIISLAKDNENVMVLFAGVGPFVVTISKARKGARVVGIEKNPYAYRCMVRNIAANRAINAKAEQGDVRTKARKYAGFADRVVMPLPWSSLKFLDSAILVAKAKATVHLYVFGNTDAVLKDSWAEIRAHAKKNNYSAKMLFSRVVRPYSAKESEIVIDFSISKKRAAPKSSK